MERVILARHGESEHNPEQLINGDPSRRVRLTERGTVDARRLGQEIAGETIDLCVVTEFLRTQQTADIALAGRKVARLVLPELNDPMVGFFEGRPIEEMRSWLEEQGTLAQPPGGGEPRVEVIRRYCRGFRLVAARPESVLLIVAHGLPVEAVMSAALGESVPLTLEHLPAAHGRARRLGRDELLAGIERMQRWVAEQEAA